MKFNNHINHALKHAVTANSVICWIVDLNNLRTSDNFIRWIGHFLSNENVIQASYNAIFTLDKIYPADSELSAE